MIAVLLYLLLILGVEPIGLTSSKGEPITPASIKEGQPGALVIFTTVDCPIANAYQPEIRRIYETFGPDGHGFAITLIHVDPAVDAKTATTHAEEYSIPCPIALDPDHLLVAELGATITPEAALILPDGILAYRGRIDDWYDALGKRRRQPRTHDLRDALQSVLDGTEIAAPRTEAIGCYIADLKPPSE